MRALRVVGLTEDGDVVLEDPVRLERFRAPADERLRAAARGDLSRLGQIAIELESQLRPREIQARIRAGASVEQVAAAAGVPEQKIERFAYPVLLERFRTAENAQRAHPVRADGPENRTLAEVVAHTFGLRGQAYEGARWDSWKGEDGRWVVALGWRAGRSENRAHWTFQPGAHGGTVTALDEHASDLVEGLPARPLRTVGAVVDMNRPEEEPPPTPSPVEQWRAAASDSYRERMPHAPSRRARPWTAVPAPASSGGPRPRRSGRPSPWTCPRRRLRSGPRRRRWRHGRSRRGSCEQRTGSYRAAEAGPERDNGHRTAAGWAPPERGGTADRRGPVVPEQARAETPHPSPRTRAHAPRAHAPGAHALRAHAQPRAPARRAGLRRPRTVGPRAHPGGRPAEPAPAPVDVSPTAPASSRRRTPVSRRPPHRTRQHRRRPHRTRPHRTQPHRTPAAPDTSRTGHGHTGTAPGHGATRAEVTAPDATEVVADRPEQPAAEAPPAEAPAPDQSVTAVPPAGAPPVDTPAAEAPAANRRTRKGKPVMPSWDEVLLGVRGPR